MTFELDMEMHCLAHIARECSVSASMGEDCDRVIGDDVVKPTERA